MLQNICATTTMVLKKGRGKSLKSLPEVTFVASLIANKKDFYCNLNISRARVTKITAASLVHAHQFLLQINIVTEVRAVKNGIKINL